MTYEEKRQYQKMYRDENKERRKLYNEINKESISARQKKYDELNKSHKKEYQKEYNIHNKDKRRINDVIYNKKRRKNDPLYKLKSNISVCIYKSFTRKNYKKSQKTEIILGCNIQELKLYLESKFEEWMNWENHGKYNGELNYGWDLDHIIPISSAQNEEDIIKLNHFSNLQPLCSYTNRFIKRNLIINDNE